MQEKNDKDELKKTLKKILDDEDLTFHKELTASQVNELGVSILDYAAALSFINQSNVRFNNTEMPMPGENVINSKLEPVLFKPKLVRYRIEIGDKHKVSIDEIKAVLVEVSGVDRNCIGKLDIRNHYTLVELPDGMSSDIFQLLVEAEIHEQRLNIKRVKYKRRYLRRNNKNR
jgi:hypothetical protein